MNEFYFAVTIDVRTTPKKSSTEATIKLNFLMCGEKVYNKILHAATGTALLLTLYIICFLWIFHRIKLILVHLYN